MSEKKVTWFTIATNDDHPMNLETLKAKCTKWAYAHHCQGKDESHPHIHFVGYLNANSRTTVKYIAQWAGLAENMVEIVRSVYGILEYLTHANQPEKQQYTAESVVSDFDWQATAKKEKEKADAKQDKSDIRRYADECCKKILKGIIRPYNMTKYITGECWIYYKQDFKSAFEYYEQQARKVNRDMKTIFFYGSAGSGKTTMAKEMARLNGYDDMDIFVSNGGANTLDGYNGEPVVILDDLRDSVLPLADFLKLTDNHTNSMVHARYYDKYMTHCKVLMVTSCVPLHEWYSNSLEDRNQLYRRFPTRFECAGLDMDTSMVKYRMIEWKKGENLLQYPYSYLPVTIGNTTNPMAEFIKIALENSKPVEVNPMAKVYESDEKSSVAFVDVTDSEELPF